MAEREIITHKRLHILYMHTKLVSEIMYTENLTQSHNYMYMYQLDPEFFFRIFNNDLALKLVDM